MTEERGKCKIERERERERERAINLQQQSIIEQGIVVAWWKKRSKPSFVVLHIGTILHICCH